ncbi:leucine-rich repeat and guanylate kinase domain-containing protein isoform X1 [Electrophorus electricus]|uniref:leucine-rich repeat and guanylate kinase domain-containing protein isoform X1 n=1 Tax=Electrophorus electricus TaxID=8005 RepID=UPI0015D0A87E|nr:leucine-rich repeat and guanylate kinase domain-containing protein isoform X1 [Electrophorus electricus]XP_035383664.1 leucine-rich repeat and guanylate kinase domain-containing protein isoform X1 [Electrophorus electricus]
MEEEGELSEDVVWKCLSSLGLSGTGLQHVYQCLSVSRQNLKNVSILCNYVHLQKLELPYNKIRDLSCVSHMPYLIILDASHNELSDFFGFEPPKNLKEVNFSHNHLSVMKDLSTYTSLSKLNLDYNSFSEIRGLEKCSNLIHLSIAHNKISHISGLDKLPLRHLSLRGNLIKKIENLQTLWALQFLDLSYNRIQSLSGLQNLHLLGSINLESNLISEIKETKHLHDLLLLRELNLQRNPVQEKPEHRLAVIFLLQHLTHLDEQAVTAQEKVSAVNKYDPPQEVVAARDHMTHVVFQHMQPQVIFDSTLPNLETPYPILVLTGPQACGKREIAHKLCQEFSHYFAYGASHTTRGPYFGEEDCFDYHFVLDEEFQNMIHMGNFVQTIQYGGHWYGLSREAIESVAREGLACCVHMELEGVYSMKHSYFEPRYILLIPTRTDEYISRMKARGLYSKRQIDTAVSRINLYVRVNKEQPGFFDSVIPCDNREEAYSTLRQLVQEYLGLEEQGTEVGDSTRTIPDHTPTDMSSKYQMTENAEANPTDSYNRNYRSKVQACLSPQKTSAELASIHRRQQMVGEALMGRSPGAYTQLFKRHVPIAPSLVAPQTHPGHSSSLIPTFGCPLPDLSDDSSSEESRASSGLSMHSSAGVLSVRSPAAGLDTGSGPRAEPLGVSMLGQNLESLKDVTETGLTPDAPHLGPEQVSPTLATSTGRPGSRARPVLPPIPTGRKATDTGPRP